MKTFKDGGQAFPGDIREIEYDNNFHHPTVVRYPGMTLRDYFAAHAPISRFVDVQYGLNEISINFAAKQSYLWADAMIKARNE